MKKALEIIQGEWVLYDGYKWKVGKSERRMTPAGDRMLVLLRENLETRKFREINGTWEAGRSTVWKQMFCSGSRVFETCKPDTEQFKP